MIKWATKVSWVKINKPNSIFCLIFRDKNQTLKIVKNGKSSDNNYPKKLNEHIKINCGFNRLKKNYRNN